MIAIKVLISAVIIFSCIAVALMVVNSITDFKIKWLDNITSYVIAIYLPVAGTFLAVLFIAAVILVIYAIWTKM